MVVSKFKLGVSRGMGEGDTVNVFFHYLLNMYRHSAYYALSVCRIPGQLICGLGGLGKGGGEVA